MEHKEDICKKCEFGIKNYVSVIGTIHVPEFKAMAVCNQHMDHGAFDLTLHLKFCPWCGRPLTPEAWAELEKRLRG